MTLTAATHTETTYLEQLERLEPAPLVEEDARWGLTIAGARVLGRDTDRHAAPDALAHWLDAGGEGRWYAL